MKAVGLTRYLPIDHPEALLDIELPVPKALGHDLLVKVHAVSVNPIDTKIRRAVNKDASKVESQPKVLGWDAAGEVMQVGGDVSLFNVGDKVYYAGDVTRHGTNAEYQLVDERIAGHQPQTLTEEEAAALPLTAVTAWESLFDRLGITEDLAKNQQKSILIIGGAGGVGSIAIQLAKKVAGLQVITTASRAESRHWVTALGADVVINHHEDLVAQMRDANHAQVDYILCNSTPDDYFPAMVQLIKPQGKICALVDTQQPLDLLQLKAKSATFVWESMFTRSMFQTDDMIAQHYILERIATLVDHGSLKTTLSEVRSPINAENLRAVHAQLESGSTIGKIVLSGWE
jgi:NADPH2:quinone reductase